MALSFFLDYSRALRVRCCHATNLLSDSFAALSSTRLLWNVVAEYGIAEAEDVGPLLGERDLRSRTQVWRVDALQSDRRNELRSDSSYERPCPQRCRPRTA